MKEIPRECGSRTEQARETGNLELAQGTATAAKEGEQCEERRQTYRSQRQRKKRKRKRQERTGQCLEKDRIVILQPERQRTIIKRKPEQGSKQRTPEQQTKARQRPKGKETPKAKRKRG